MTFLVSIFGVIVGIGLLIFVHELGHYLAARAAGVRVEVFSLGFGPRLFGFVRGHTDYRIALIPLGGYVRVAGEDPTQRTGLASDDLYGKSAFARAVFFSGGVVMNFLFAFVAFPIVFGQGVQVAAPVVGSVTPGGPAWLAGIEVGDRILRIGHKPIPSQQSLLLEFALGGGRDPLAVEIERDGVKQSLLVAPRYDEANGIYTAGIGESFVVEAPLVESVTAEGPAARAGIRQGDRIVAIGGAAVDTRTIAERLSSAKIGQEIDFTLERDGQARQVRLVVGSIPAPQRQIGLYLSRPVVTALRPAPSVQRIDLQVGDRILAIDGETFDGQRLATAEKSPGELRLRVARDHAPLDLKATLDAEERAEFDRSVALGPVAGTVVVSPRDGSPAAAAGIRPGDTVRVASGRELRSFEDLLEVVRNANGRTILATVETRREDGSLDSREVSMSPAQFDLPDLGFLPELTPLRETVRADSFTDALHRGYVASIDMIRQLYVTLKRLVTGEVSARNLSGIVGISVVTYRQVRQGWVELLYWLAILSLNLAVVNLLPIPLFDGGHLLFLLIEKVRGAPMSARVLNYSQVMGLVFVLALVVFVTFNDIRRLFS